MLPAVPKMLLSCLSLACGAIAKHLTEAITSEAFMQAPYMAMASVL